MNDINRQVSKARQRIFLGKFFRILGWSLFAGLLVAAVGLTFPKIWALESLDTDAAVKNWNVGWIAGGAGLSFLISIVLTWVSRGSSIDAAMEVDRRFGLKERISSALSLAPQVAESAAGAALIEDANRRAQKIDVRDEFPFKPTWKALLPLFPAMVLAALIFLPNATQETRAESPESLSEKKKQVRVAIKESKKKLRDKLNQLEEKGLQDAKLDFKSLGRKIDELETEKGELKKDALVKLNEIKKQLDSEKKQFGDAEEMKKNFNKLRQVEQGPARKLNDALAQGNFEEARKAIKDLAEKLKEGKLNEVEQKQLANNLQQMAKDVKDMVRDHEEMKQELKDRIQQAMQKGDLNEAAKLQERLDQRQAKDRQMQKMQKMADNLEKAADAMKQRQQQNNQKQQSNNKQKSNQKQGQQGQQGQSNKDGNPSQGKQNGEGQSQKGQQQSQQGGQPSESDMKAAQQALEDLAEEMENIQADLDSLEALEDLEKDLQECKDGLNGCKGAGDKPGWKDWGQGEGRGGGKRSRSEGDTGHYRSRVKGKIQRGQSVVTGNADGKNVPGQSVTEARALIQASISDDTDPLEDQKLPRSQREHAKQYFEKLRGK